MRTLIRFLDALLRRANGVFEFCDAPACLFRLQITGAPHDLHLADGTAVSRGEPVLILHLWNERAPRMAHSGPDLAWATRLQRMLLCSVRLVAHWLVEQPQGASVRAVGGVTVLESGLRVMHRLGFEIHSYRGPLGRFGELWENLYAWGLMWTFNAPSVRRRPPHRLRRAEMWMSALAFVRRHGPTRGG